MCTLFHTPDSHAPKSRSVSFLKKSHAPDSALRSPVRAIFPKPYKPRFRGVWKSVHILGCLNVRIKYQIWKHNIFFSWTMENIVFKRTTMDVQGKVSNPLYFSYFSPLLKILRICDSRNITYSEHPWWWSYFFRRQNARFLHFLFFEKIK